MRMFRMSGRVVVALALSLSVPLASANAASRASTAVPSADVTATASPQDGRNISAHWPLYAFAVIAAAVLVFVLANGDSDEDKPVSRG